MKLNWNQDILHGFLHLNMPDHKVVREVSFYRLERASSQRLLSQLWPWFWGLALNEVAAIDCITIHMFFMCSRLSVRTLLFFFKGILNKGNIW